MPIRKIIGKNAPKIGTTPAVLLVNPKYKQNVARIVRSASSFGAKQVWYSGNRFSLEDGQRLPREERMKGYADVDIIQYDYPFEQFESVTPIAVEVMPGATPLHKLEHPDNPLYVFGPEDGSIPSVVRRHCHQFVSIPSHHCLNLSMAVTLVLWERFKQFNDEATLETALHEQRGFIYDPVFDMDED